MKRKIAALILSVFVLSSASPLCKCCDETNCLGEEFTSSSPTPTERIFTREQLMSLENKSKGYGPGVAFGGKRPSGALGCQNTYGKYASHFIGPDEKRIYLTFDCGYEYTTNIGGKKVRVTEWILDTLKQKDVQAVFFVTKHYCAQNPDLMQRMVDEGHAIGNHTASHPIMPNCTVEKMETEIMDLHNYVQEHFGYSMNLFRPPAGEYSTRVLAAAQNLGYKNVFWSFAYKDWETANQPSKDKAMKTVLDRAHNGAIYLLHSVSVTNAEILGDAIDELRNQGYAIELFQ